MLQSTLINYPGTLAGVVASALCLLFVALAFTVYRKEAKRGLEYASRLPLELEDREGQSNGK
jgi:cbb3-type cytochrome oxidase subunit 3